MNKPMFPANSSKIDDVWNEEDLRYNQIIKKDFENTS
jgi:hypothetical protein